MKEIKKTAKDEESAFLFLMAMASAVMAGTTLLFFVCIHFVKPFLYEEPVSNSAWDVCINAVTSVLANVSLWVFHAWVVVKTFR